MGTPPSRVYLGVQGEDGGGGARLTQITENSPAAKAELKAGDVVKSIDKKPIKAYEQLAEQLRARKTGDKVTLEVVRDDKTHRNQRHARRSAARRRRGRWRRQAARRSRRLIGATGQDDEKGVRIIRVQSERAAEKAGLEDGDVIQSVDAKAVADNEQLATAAARSQRPATRSCSR